MLPYFKSEPRLICVLGPLKTQNILRAKNHFQGRVLPNKKPKINIFRRESILKAPGPEHRRLLTTMHRPLLYITLIMINIIANMIFMN